MISLTLTRTTRRYPASRFQTYYNDLNLVNREKQNLIWTNKYLKTQAEINEKNKIRQLLIPSPADEPKKPTTLNFIVAASICGVSFYFYQYYIRRFKY
jgi:hypothetical protein